MCALTSENAAIDESNVTSEDQTKNTLCPDKSVLFHLVGHLWIITKDIQRGHIIPLLCLYFLTQSANLKESLTVRWLATRLHVNVFLANLKILDVFSIYSLQVSSFMYLFCNGALTLSLTQIFQTGHQIHQDSTRYFDFYRPHACRKIKYWKFSILFQSPRRLDVFKTYLSDWSNHF